MNGKYLVKFCLFVVGPLSLLDIPIHLNGVVLLWNGRFTGKRWLHVYNSVLQHSFFQSRHKLNQNGYQIGVSHNFSALVNTRKNHGEIGELKENMMEMTSYDM